ncbi:MAG: hypothetical protein ACK4ME_06320, partial [Fimbriimonadales bacterium]
YRLPDSQTLDAAAVNTPTPNLTLRIDLPPAHKLNPNAQSQLRIEAQGATIQGKAELVAPLQSLQMRLPIQLNAERATLSLHLLIYYCREGQEGLCYLYERRLTLPVQQGGNLSEIVVNLTVNQ